MGDAPAADAGADANAEDNKNELKKKKNEPGRAQLQFLDGASVFLRLADNQQEAACAKTYVEAFGTADSRLPYASLQQQYMPHKFTAETPDTKVVEKYRWDKAKWDKMASKQSVSKAVADVAKECKKRVAESAAGTEAGLLKEMNRAFAKRQDITHYNF